MLNTLELKNKYLSTVEQFKIAYDKAEKDDALRIDARKLAQRCLGMALDLRHRYEEMMHENPAYSADVSAWQRQIERLQERLEKLGSSMSGIPSTTFDDIAGLDEVKETIKNYLFAIKNPEVAREYNINASVGMLMYGPPGTGKTLVAKAIAHELGVRFFVITPSTIFGSYVGESERNVRDIFAELRACEDGAVLLVDECESIFSRRGQDSNRAAIGVANQLLQEMNGANDSGERRVILGATNRPWDIDEAYLRYKRFSLQFYIGMPEQSARIKVIDSNLARLPHDEELREALINTLGDGYTCADISGIIEQCSYLALEEYRRNTEISDGVAVDYVKIGIRHLDLVMKSFSKSVSQSLIKEYEAFREARKSGV